jgi:hypothetical protein
MGSYIGDAVARAVRPSDYGEQYKDEFDSDVPPDIVAQIRKDYCAGVQGRGIHSLARRFGVSDGTIRAVLAGRRRSTEDTEDGPAPAPQVSTLFDLGDED